MIRIYPAGSVRGLPFLTDRHAQPIKMPDTLSGNHPFPPKQFPEKESPVRAKVNSVSHFLGFIGLFCQSSYRSDQPSPKTAFERCQDTDLFPTLAEFLLSIIFLIILDRNQDCLSTGLASHSQQLPRQSGCVFEATRAFSAGLHHFLPVPSSIFRSRRKARRCLESCQLPCG